MRRVNEAPPLRRGGMRIRGWMVAAAVAATAAFGGAAAGADWLVLRDGQRVETKGAWNVKGKLVVFTQTDGKLASLRLDTVDLDASARATVEARELGSAPPPAPAEPPRATLVLTDADFPRLPGEAEAEAEPAGDAGEGATPATAPAAKDVEVVAVEQSELGGAEGGLSVTGTLRNNGSALATGLIVLVQLVASDGSVIASRPANVLEPAIPAGQTTTFRIAFPGVTAVDDVKVDVSYRTILVPSAPQPEEEGSEPVTIEEAPPA